LHAFDLDNAVGFFAFGEAIHLKGWLPTVVEKWQQKIRSSQRHETSCYFLELEFFESINACAIFMLEVHQFERIKLCVAMVTMWPKRQQSDIKFYTKNEFIKISFSQSF
jgi:hypothetical protein